MAQENIPSPTRSLLKLIVPVALLCAGLGWVLTDPYWPLPKTDLQTPVWRILAMGAAISGAIVGAVSALVFGILGWSVAERSKGGAPTGSQGEPSVRWGAKICGRGMIIFAIGLAVFFSISMVSLSTFFEGFGSPPIFVRIYSFTPGHEPVPAGYGVHWLAAVQASIFPGLAALIGGYVWRRSD